jgi:uncharacterized membrane protein YccF (DUF307 family)
MLEIVKLNSKTSNNNIRLVIIMLVISIAKLVAAAFAVSILAIPFKLATFVVLIIATPFKRSAYKAARGCIANSIS